MAKSDKSEWESLIQELTRLVEKFPSRQLYRQLADCYRHVDEDYEAQIMLDLANGSPSSQENKHIN